MSWLFKKQNINLFNQSKKKLIPFFKKQIIQQKKFFFTTQQEYENSENESAAFAAEQDENYRIQFPYSSNINEDNVDDLQISKVNVDDYHDIANRMNDFFWDNTLVKAFKIKKNQSNRRILFNMWLNHLNENLSLKSYYKSNPNKINGIIINSPHSQFHEYTELLDLADMAETIELNNYFLALADIVQKPKIYSEYSKILEINGIGVNKLDRNRGIGRKLLNESIKLGLNLGFDQFRSDCTNCIEGEALFRNDWQQVSKIPFNRYNNIDENLSDSNIKIYEKSIQSSLIET